MIGPNGAGKSTLVRAICGQAPVVRGQIVYHWQDAQPQKHIAYVTFDLPPSLAVENSFYQARWNSGIDLPSPSVEAYLQANCAGKTNPYQVVAPHADPAECAARIRCAVEQLDIGNLLRKQINQLSNGEMRKVLIAEALIKNPRLLILDNPFAGLDGQSRDRLQHTIAGLMDRRNPGHIETQVMVVTTRPDEILPGMTHILAVEAGRVIAQGSRETALPSWAPSAAETGKPYSDLSAWVKSDSSTRDLRPDIVRMHNVNVSYNGAKILQQINWTVRQGERWALVGPNGAGKTTLLSLILGDHPQAYSNDIALFGRPRGTGESIWDIKQRIGWVSSELHTHYPRHTPCLDVVCSGLFDSIGLHHRCSASQRQIAQAWLARLGLAHNADVTLSALSQGQQRLALLARALVKEPPLLILDEPCQGLDDTHRQRVRQVIDEIVSALDTTLIYVTHRLDELPRTLTHAIQLDRGCVSAQGRLETTYIFQQKGEQPCFPG